ncbi:MAG: ABC transporter substrate-binding protein [Clostridium chrysemydis]|uniref:ABC transporter substrate-binding protein n=1 Tax=Clostridium chrysemydis TaxID=2665504 RepID=UPI003F2EF21F
MVGKKIIGALGVAFLICLVGCSSKEEEKNEKIKIGVCQLIQHDALDKAYEGFKDRLLEKGYENSKNIDIDYKNAQGDFQTAQTINKQFSDSKKDLIFAIATPAAQAAYNCTKEIPIVFTAVTDPVSAKIASSFKSSGNNVTGVSDMVPIDKQLDLLKSLVKDVKSIGFIYNTSEANSVVQLNNFKNAASKNNINVVEIGITNVNEIDQNLKSAINKIDALYTPTDNTVASSYSLVGKICRDKKIPVLGAEEAMINAGGLVTLGIDYYELGKEAANKAIRIIEGEKPSEIEITTLENLKIKINENVAKELNIEVPKEIREKADFISRGDK